MIYGLDMPLAAMYPQIALKAHVKGYAWGCFALEGGDAFPLVQKLSKSGKCPIIRIQLTWAGSSHSYTNSHLQAAIKEAKRYDKVGGTSHIQLSGFCEHTLSSPDPWLDQIAAAAPSCAIVNNPENGKGAFSHKYQNEIHTGPPPPFGLFNYSYDGKSSFKVNISADKRLYHGAQVFFGWTYELNCHSGPDDKTRNTRPTPKLIKDLARVIQ